MKRGGDGESKPVKRGQFIGSRFNHLFRLFEGCFKFLALRVFTDGIRGLDIFIDYLIFKRYRSGVGTLDTDAVTIGVSNLFAPDDGHVAVFFIADWGMFEAIFYFSHPHQSAGFKCVIGCEESTFFTSVLKLTTVKAVGIVKKVRIHAL